MWEDGWDDQQTVLSTRPWELIRLRDAVGMLAVVAAVLLLFVATGVLSLGGGGTPPGPTQRWASFKYETTKRIGAATDAAAAANRAHLAGDRSGTTEGDKNFFDESAILWTWLYAHPPSPCYAAAHEGAINVSKQFVDAAMQSEKGRIQIMDALADLGTKVDAFNALVAQADPECSHAAA
jgi:hypothetical protein